LSTTNNKSIENWQPPDNFTQIDSKVEGITVFAPKKIDDLSHSKQIYDCPNCGASTKFDVASGGVACEYCGYVKTIHAKEVGKQAQSFEFTLPELQVKQAGAIDDRKQLTCGNCGAELSLPVENISATCPFCGSNKVNLRKTLSEKLRPNWLISFKIKPNDLLNIAREWLGKGWFHPKDLSSLVSLDHFHGIYMPFWTFSTSIDASWKAEVGHEHQETYFQNGERKTRTVIRWRWESGNVLLAIKDWLTEGSKNINTHIFENIKPFDLNQLIQYNPDYLAGWQSQTYNIQLEDAWTFAKGEIREKAKSACYSDIGSSHVRNFRMSADFDKEKWRLILLPLYLASYQFEDQTYQVMVNGQSGKIAGEKPVEWWKVWLAIAAILSPGVISGFYGLVSSVLFDESSVCSLGLGIILFTIGVILSIVIYRKAKDSEGNHGS
jgi:DNA-directed RNA polymerase subunit RPC12/RpoP